jgi:hypothetical protein
MCKCVYDHVCSCVYIYLLNLSSTCERKYVTFVFLNLAYFTDCEVPQLETILDDSLSSKWDEELAKCGITF